ncbi:FHA domain-containing protein [Hoyosella altamirensis]|uniref:PSer/pThr/pTyr-binding forkhead associated (FHA) protein n=1 Tax=Hoyosella altamirensis TaxID=616997 RepID=A0A839RUD2_9ACTN|nr:FHA domain-containing protein [Hoyosella altamirensis]MBB3039836.1 pSer/pThr/pTyr-binding forkhead associated (FHA) protein [Hoyosella altamirensis]
MEEPGRWRVYVSDAAGRRRYWDFPTDVSRLTIGRSEQADISLAGDSQVSRLHAALETIAGEWTVVDDGLSRNGTFVNGQRITGRRRLRHKDVILVGETALTFEDMLGSTGTTTRVGSSSGGVPVLTETQRNVLIALCRPYKDNASFARPAANQQIADELFLSVDAVKTHLRTLFAKFQVEELPQNQKRSQLAERAMQLGVITVRDL